MFSQIILNIARILSKIPASVCQCLHSQIQTGQNYPCSIGSGKEMTLLIGHISGQLWKVVSRVNVNFNSHLTDRKRTNTFFTLDKYILQFGQIHFSIWRNTFHSSRYSQRHGHPVTGASRCTRRRTGAELTQLLYHLYPA